MGVRSNQERELKMEARVAIDRKSEAAIFSRVVDRSMSNFSPETIRSILNLGFSEEDHARVHDLTTRNQDGALSWTRA
jgi:hypothetical protein